MIEVSNLTKRYGSKVAVGDISFTVEKGEILGFLGPNGAGKTTTMNILTGYIAATGGTCKIAGFDIFDEPLEAKKHIGYLPENPPVYQDMTVAEYLQFVSELKGVKGNYKEQLKEIMEKVRIADVSGRLIKNLSKGYKQRVGIAQAMVGNPEVLILDEPTVGLDPTQIIETRALIKELGKEHTIILSTHILPEVSAVCDRVIIINKGKIVAIDKPENLANRVDKKPRLMVHIKGGTEQVMSVLHTIDGVISIEKGERKEDDVREYYLETEEGKDVQQNLFYALANAQLPILMLQSVEMSLEEAFVEITSKDYAEVVEETAGEDIPEDMLDEEASYDESIDEDATASEEFESDDNADADSATQEGGDTNDSNS